MYKSRIPKKAFSSYENLCARVLVCLVFWTLSQDYTYVTLVKLLYYKRPTGFAGPPHLAKLPQGTHPHANQVGQVLGYCGSQSNTLIFKLSSSKPGFLLTLNSSKAGFLLGKRPTGFANPHLLLFCPKAFNPKLQRSMHLQHAAALTHLAVIHSPSIIANLPCKSTWKNPFANS